MKGVRLGTHACRGEYAYRTRIASASYNDAPLRYFSAVLRILIAAALVATCTSAAVRAGATAGPAAAKTEVRGMWVLRTSLVSPAAIDKLVREAGDAGINALFVQVRGRGDAYYASDLEPRGTLLASQPASFDPLAVVIREAHARGIAVHAWINVNLVSGARGLSTSPAHLIRRHPEWLMIPRALAGRASRANPRDRAYLDALVSWTNANIARVEGLYISPLPAGARAHAVSIARDLATRYPLDGLHLDYVRFPNEMFDFSAAAVAEFRASLPPGALAGLDRAAPASPTMLADRFPAEWDAFRRSRVTWLVDGMAAAARDARPGILISAAVIPDPAAALSIKQQDWPAWAARGLVDAICPMAYAEDRDTFNLQLESARNAAGPAAVWTGIGAYRLTAAETASRVREARGAGASGVLLFSYDSISQGRAGARYLADVARAVFLP